eukprot:334998-Chlamydomonas_euryale.AAC.10
MAAATAAASAAGRFVASPATATTTCAHLGDDSEQEIIRHDTQLGQWGGLVSHLLLHRVWRAGCQCQQLRGQVDRLIQGG